MKRHGSAALGAAAMLLGALAPARAETVKTPDRVLLALSKADATLSVIDPATLAILAKVPTGPDPHELLSPDGRTVYVSNYGGGPGGYPDTLLSEIDVIDARSQEVIERFDTAPLLGPHGLSWAGGKLYFTAQASKALGRYDPKLNKVDWILGTGMTFTHFLKVSPDEKTIVTMNVDAGPGSPTGSMSVFRLTDAHPPHYLPTNAKPRETGADWTQTVIPLGLGVEGLAVSPDFTEAWTADLEGTIHVVDIAGATEAAKLPDGPKGAHRLTFAEGGKYVVVVSILENDGTPDNDAPEKLGRLQVWDAAARTRVGDIRIGCQGAGLLADEVGHRVFVSCTPQNVVRVVGIDPATGAPSVGPDLDVGGRPDALAFAAE
ncbi:YncE family protein [Amaricoccus solimangrovi]|uniref:YncE family protein n=1 Tax=Amaricoccus solimangrovi TaxID=2589815 RepID=UPI0015E312C1|nr:YncE family protein [Amaricoccus solimangrovi]